MTGRSAPPCASALPAPTALSRRALIGAGAAGLALAPWAQAASPPVVDQEVWTFDNLSMIGGLAVTVIGAPGITTSPYGPALSFDGFDDAIFLDRHPLADASEFTFEAIFRPDGGAFEQRWFHLEADPGPGVAPGRGDIRTLFEIRVIENHWYLDAFTCGEGYRQALMAPDKLHPVGRWHHVAQTFNGDTYRAYVDGVLQTEAAIAYKPQGAGRASVGVRMNRVNYFNGAIREARFTRKALGPEQFARL